MTGVSRPLAMAAAWLAFIVGLLISGDVEDLVSLLIAAFGGAALVVPGFLSAWRRRPLPQRDQRLRLRLALLTLAVGVGLGLANLAANWLIAQRDPAIHALLAERMVRVSLRPVGGIVAAPLVEEVIFRLFLISVAAWLAFHVTKQERASFVIALLGSSLLFSLLHLDRPFPGDSGLASYYQTALVVKYTLAGLPLGWVFWRWGLPYSILCHAAANAAHLALQKTVF